MRQKTSFHFFAILLWLAVVSANAQEAAPLAPGKAIEREITGGQTHTYTIALKAGQFVHFDVQQISCDVILTLNAPDGKKIVEANATMFRFPETLSAIAEVAGEHRLSVQRSNFVKIPGQYQIQLTLHNQPTEKDKQHLRAERLLFGLYTGLSPQQRLDNAQQALTIWRDLGERYWEAYTLSVLSFVHGGDFNQHDKAIELTEQALTIVRELKDRASEALLTANLGWFYYNKGQVEKNIECYERSLAVYREIDDKFGEGELLERLANYYYFKGDDKKARPYLEPALAIALELGARQSEMRLRGLLGRVLYREGKTDLAMAAMDTALKLAQELHQQAVEVDALDRIGEIYYFGKGDGETAIRYHQQSLALARMTKNRVMESWQLMRIGLIYREDGQYEKARDHYEPALVIARELKSHLQMAILNRLGGIYGSLYGADKCIAAWEEMLTVSRSFNHKINEADALLNLSFTILWDKENLSKAVELAEQALAISQAAKYYVGESFAWRFLGDCHRLQVNYEKAIECFQNGIRTAKLQPWKQYDAMSYFSLGGLYYFLGQYDKALEETQKGMQINEQIVVENRRPTGAVYYLMGQIYQTQKQFDKALEVHEKLLAFGRKFKSPEDEAQAHQYIGADYVGLAQYDRAIASFQRARAILTPLQKRGLEAQLELETGKALFGQKNYSEAIVHHQQGLLLYRQTVLGKPYEAPYYEQLMKDWKASKNATLAIFYGKQAINSYQDVRYNIRNLEKDLQQSFLKSKEQTYRELADLLISQGRLPESEQVIRMLKEEEYFEYVRRDGKNAPKSEKAALTPEEAALDKRYREIADQLTTLGTERSALLDKKTRTTDEEQRLTKLDNDLAVAAQVFQKFLDQLSVELTTKKGGAVRASQLTESQAFMDDLRELGKGTVALYTVVSEDKFHVILTTPELRKSYSYPIKAAALNRKILDFRTALQNPKLDPLPLAQELYNIIVAPLARDLQAAKAETLMWSLDGVLRYMPIAALHDGKQYLVERWRNVVFTSASKARLKDEPRRQWNALGLGVTKAHGLTIPALPAVADEMRGIIREAGSQTGVLPGLIKLDEAFTQEAMMTGLRGRPPVVHVASHFQFKPGNETDSALLLGDGNFLSLAKIKTMTTPFAGVELLTLSACNTATGGSDANGKEIEGFGMLAQSQGAKAVVASLWPVADRSTQELMKAFYQLRETNHTTKSAALQEAQRKLLRGERMLPVDLTKREIVHEVDKNAKLPSFKPDPKKPYAHPYYWAPFILIGNWK